jgi:hypothetical protein
MLRMKTAAAVLLIAAISMGGMLVQAADPSVAASEVVQYRLKAWRTTHAEGSKAEKFVGTLKKLRCEVKVGSHGGHTDVKYRCEKWQSLALKDHKTAHQWESWLKKYGFETKHEH